MYCMFFHRQTTLHPLPARYRKARQSFLPFLRSLVLNPHPRAPWPWAPPQAPPPAIPATCHPTGIHLAIFSTHISLVPQSTITCPKHHFGSQVIRALLWLMSVRRAQPDILFAKHVENTASNGMLWIKKRHMERMIMLVIRLQKAPTQGVKSGKPVTIFVVNNIICLK